MVNWLIFLGFSFAAPVTVSSRYSKIHGAFALAGGDDQHPYTSSPSLVEMAQDTDHSSSTAIRYLVRLGPVPQLR